ncbi:CHAT domain-containing protein [Nostoc punctiforme UO1]|uniref:CHAT domain-containing protein n=1 Tax=Nostoc punctiforme TaxID=272131 RepID=UPI0030B2A01C
MSNLKYISIFGLFILTIPYLIAGKNNSRAIAFSSPGINNKNIGILSKVAQTIVLESKPVLNNQDDLQLEVGKLIEREIHPHEAHNYQLKLQVGKYVKIVVKERSVDLVVKLFGVDGKQIKEVNDNLFSTIVIPYWSESEEEEIVLLTEVAGNYRLEVRSVPKSETLGRYDMSIEELRNTIPSDKIRLAAKNAFIDSSQRWNKPTGPSDSSRYEESDKLNEDAQHLYQQALELDRAEGNKKAQAATLTQLGDIYYYYDQFERNKRIDYYSQALQIWQELGNREQEAYTLSRIGDCYGSSGYSSDDKPIKSEPQKALEYYQQAIQLERQIGDRYREAYLLRNIAYIYDKPKDYDKIIDYLKQALSVWQALGDRLWESDALGRIGYFYEQKEDLQTALLYYKQELEVNRALGDRITEAGTLEKIAYVYHDNLEEYQQAIEYGKQALQVYRTTRNRSKSAEAKVLAIIGDSYLKLSNYQQALLFLNKGLTFYREDNNHSDEAPVLATIAEIYSALGKPQQALNYYKQILSASNTASQTENKSGISLTIDQFLEYHSGGYEEKSPLEQRQEDIKNLIMFAVGFNFVRRKPEQALTFLNKALSIAQAIKDQSREADALIGLAAVYNSIDENQKSLEYLNKALPLLNASEYQLETMNVTGRMDLWKVQKSKVPGSVDLLVIDPDIPINLKDILSIIAGAYFNAGEPKQALIYLYHARLVAHSQKNRSYEASLLNLIGGMYQSMGELPVALNYLNQAQLIYKSEKDLAGEANTFELATIVYLNQGEKQKALDSLNQALSLYQAVGDRFKQANILDLIGKGFLSQGKQQESFDYFNKALSLYQAVGNRSKQASTLYDIGSLLEKQNQPELAIVFYKQSVNVRESIRQDIRTLPHDLQKSYTQTVADAYRHFADLLLSQGRILEAQQVLELLKIQELRNFTRNARAGGETTAIALAHIEEDILNKYGTLIAFGAKVYECDRQKCSELSQLRDQLDALTTKFNQDSKAFRKTLQQRKADDPALLEPAQISNTAARIVTAEPGTILIYPLVLKDKIRILLAARAGEKGVVFRSFETPVSQEQLWKTVAQFRTQLSNSSDLAAVKATSQQLYDWLIKPLESELKDKTVQHLVFALDRSTRYIPMAALFDGQQYLIQRYGISTVLNAGLTDVSDRLPPNKQDTHVLAMGVSKGFSGFNPLSNVPQELNTIVQQSGNERVGIFPGLELLNEAFDFRALRDHLAGNKILHIATHGKFEAGRPENSFLLSGTGEKLTIENIQNLQNYMKDTHLVVLSACETALGGVDTDGIEMSGISFYFLSNGAKAVIASLWLVNDASTSQLMQQFYQNLSTGKMTKTEALRQAQIAMITGKNLSSDIQDQRSSVKFTPGTSGQSAPISRNLSHPYYWAPFILIGNGL